jgi:hypothetical protein
MVAQRAARTIKSTYYLSIMCPDASARISRISTIASAWKISIAIKIDAHRYSNVLNATDYYPENKRVAIKNADNA